jgi:1-acyl-sn-glycerol-3-phosphate acyltransferase
MSALRAGMILLLFMSMTITLIPLQVFFLVTHLPLRKSFPHWYHKQVCRLMGMRVHVSGSPPASGPVLLVSNHISWLDIPVLSSVTPLSFVAKREVSSWPFINVLAWLQRTIFVDRTRRASVGETTSQILRRLDAKERMVLFAEGTSSDGNQVLDFKSSLFAAVEPNGKNGNKNDSYTLQTIAIAYTHVHGLPMNRQQRPAIAWYGDMDMLGHAWGVLKGGPLDVRVRLGEPVILEHVGNRKAMAVEAHRRVRADFAHILTARPPATS